MSADLGGVRVRDPEALAIAEQLPVTARRLRRIVRDISAIGSYDLGFRVAGTPEDRATAEYVADALRSARVYKTSQTHAQARETILAGSGRHFDPDMVGAFLATEERFEQVARQLADAQEDQDARVAA